MSTWRTPDDIEALVRLQSHKLKKTKTLGVNKPWERRARLSCQIFISFQWKVFIRFQELHFPIAHLSQMIISDWYRVQSLFWHLGTEKSWTEQVSEPKGQNLLAAPNAPELHRPKVRIHQPFGLMKVSNLNIRIIEWTRIWLKLREVFPKVSRHISLGTSYLVKSIFEENSLGCRWSTPVD